jgi:hypothetical protein
MHEMQPMIGQGIQQFSTHVLISNYTTTNQASLHVVIRGYHVVDLLIVVAF